MMGRLFQTLIKFRSLSDLRPAYIYTNRNRSLKKERLESILPDEFLEVLCRTNWTKYADVKKWIFPRKGTPAIFLAV